ASNGKEAIDLWERWEPHLVLMDMRMPIIDGYEATQHIKTTTKGQATVIIALTASAFEEERNVVLSAGCDDFMRKPFREEVLWDKIAHHLGICYIYESIREEDNQTGETDVKAQEDNSNDLLQLLSVMSPEWSSQVYQAAIECSDDAILNLITQIPPESELLAVTLKNWANHFLFEQIIELTNKAIVNNNLDD
ncbi:MAG: response regulator, partial [cyanobacterium endosymbiont of Rhopalodia fuxianensis]